MIKVLNLYAGIGGNRKLWKDVEVTAVEINPQIAKIYQDFFPQDKVIVMDAHDFLLAYYKNFDFIWSSPPCPTHSRMGKSNMLRKPVYPDMKLYEEILFLKHYFKGKWVVENVITYYEPLIRPQEVQRHYFWANFRIPKERFSTEKTCSINDRERLSKLFDIDIDQYEGIDKRKCLRNCVLPKLGKYVFDCAFRLKQEVLI